MAEPWIDVALYRFVLGPSEGWDQGQWDTAQWDSGLDGAGQWTSIICDVRGIDLRRGKSNVTVLGGVETGILNFDLDNRDGQWSQFIDLGGGVFVPALSAGVVVRVTSTDGTNSWVHFVGTIEGWRQEWTKTDDIVHVTAHDGWSRFVQQAAVPWTPGPLGEMAVARFSRLLQRAAFPKTSRAFLQFSPTPLIGSRTSASSGAETGLVVNGSSVADEMLRTALSDGGKCFLDGDGSFVYLNRTWLNPGPIGAIGARPAQPSVPLFGDYCGTPGASELPYTDLEWSYDGLAPLSAVVVTNAAAPETRDNLGRLIPLAWQQCGATRTGTRGETVLALGDLRFYRQADADALAAFYLNAYQHAYIACRRLDVYPALDDREWAVCNGLRIGDHIRILRRERLNTLDMEAVVEGIGLRIDPEPWRTDEVNHRHYGNWHYSYTTSDAVTTVSSVGTMSTPPVSVPEREMEEAYGALDY